MQYLIDGRAEDSLYDSAESNAARARVFPAFQAWTKDPRVIYAGHPPDGRHVVLVVELDSHEQLLEFTGPFLDFVRFTITPVIPLSRALELFPPLP
jgi:hypothetical protein